MIPWIQLETATTPDGGVLRLLRRGDELSIRIDGAELMNSRLSGSEEALATLALAQIRGTPAPRILIGGLGMGFTLRVAQATAGPDSRLVVAEIVPEVVAWARGPMAELFGDSLADPRLDLRTADVAEIIRDRAVPYDAILLDVDNGPEALTRPANDALYGNDGLRATYHALAPGGVLAVWSAAPDNGFTRRLRRCGFEAEARSVRASRTGRGARHTIWLALRPANARLG